MFVVDIIGTVSEAGDTSDDGTAAEDAIGGLTVIEDGMDSALDTIVLMGSESDKI